GAYDGRHFAPAHCEGHSGEHLDFPVPSDHVLHFEQDFSVQSTPPTPCRFAEFPPAGLQRSSGPDPGRRPGGKCPSPPPCCAPPAKTPCPAGWARRYALSWPPRRWG